MINLPHCVSKIIAGASMKCCRRYVVKGRVQGVFYRQSTLEQAEQLDIKGWVRNLDNGDVECLVCGDDEQLDSLESWLNQGPPSAKVSQVKRFEVPLEEHVKFIIKR
jgi:acylphosphatase